MTLPTFKDKLSRCMDRDAVGLYNQAVYLLREAIRDPAFPVTVVTLTEAGDAWRVVTATVDGLIYGAAQAARYVIDTIDGAVSTVRVHPHKPVKRAAPTDAIGYSQYGASMGRRATSLSSTRDRCRLFLVPLDSGGYDRGGAYWGIGRNRRSDLYCLVDDDGDAIAYVRADDRKQAAVKLSTDHVFRLARS